MAIKLGPILSFRGVLNNRWCVSVLVACDTDDAALALDWQVDSAASISVAAVSLGSYPSPTPTVQLWRFDLAITLKKTAQQGRYRLAGAEYLFSVPAKAAMPVMAYVSCNGFSSLKLMNNTKNPYAQWISLRKKHAEAGYQLLMMGGDQVYADSMFDVIPALHDWLALPLDKKIIQPYTATMSKAVERFYHQLYIKRWAQPDMAAMLAGIPSVMMWDDHDIFDGWGSYDARLQASPVYQGLFASAKACFALYQLQLARGETHPSAISGQSEYNLGMCLGTLTLLALDMRGERTDSQVISQPTWKAVYDWLDTVTNQCGHLLVMSSIPIVHPDFTMLEKALSIFPGQQELEDDLRDHWNSNPHKQERLRLIHRLLDFSESKKCRVTLLSGDVHVGAVGVIKSTRNNADESSRTLTQLTSSGIVHPPPPGMVLFFLENMVGKEMGDDRDITSTMTEFPGTRHFYIGARNWLALEPDSQQRIWANWHVENEPYPFTKVIHPIDFKMAEAVIGDITLE